MSPLSFASFSSLPGDSDWCHLFPAKPPFSSVWWRWTRSTGLASSEFFTQTWTTQQEITFNLTPCSAATVVQLCTFDDYLRGRALWPAGLVGRCSTRLSSGIFSGIKLTVWELAEAFAAEPQNCHTCSKWTQGHGWRFKECARLIAVRYGPQRVTSSGFRSSLVSRAAGQVDLTWNTWTFPEFVQFALC